jgi:hypothetical protein
LRIAKDARCLKSKVFGASKTNPDQPISDKQL